MNGTPFKLVFSFASPVALPQFVGIDAILEVRTSEATLPDWWRLASGECREGNLAFPGSLVGIGTGTTGVCQNPWTGANTGGGSLWTSDSVEAGVGRLRVVFARDVEASLAANQQYVGGVITLDSFKDADTGEGACTGCSMPACIVLSQVQLFQTVGAPGGDIQTITSAETRAYVTWQGGLAGGCAGQSSAPARLWGSIRAVVR
jgi:hypothetical protein